MRTSIGRSRRSRTIPRPTWRRWTAWEGTADHRTTPLIGNWSPSTTESIDIDFTPCHHLIHWREPHKASHSQSDGDRGIDIDRVFFTLKSGPEYKIRLSGCSRGISRLISFKPNCVVHIGRNVDFSFMNLFSTKSLALEHRSLVKFVHINSTREEVLSNYFWGYICDPVQVYGRHRVVL